MHDGSLPTLEAVIRFYDRGGAPHPGLDPLIAALQLDQDEVNALVVFLRSLTSTKLGEIVEDARSVAVGNGG